MTATLYMRNGKCIHFTKEPTGRWFKTHHGHEYELRLSDYVSPYVWVARHDRELSVWHDVTKKIHATHLKIGDVDVWFGGDKKKGG